MTSPDPSTFEVEQIADNGPNGEGIHRVQVALSGIAQRNLLSDLARDIFRLRAAGRPIFAYLIAAGRTEAHGLDRLDAITRLRNLLPAFRIWDLSPDEATALGNALLAAAEEPASCDCGRLIEKPSSLTTASGCSVCAARVFGSEV